MLFERAAVIGIGLIGGSFALATRRRGLVREVIGVARRRETLDAAMAVGAVDEVTTDPIAAVAAADLIYLATPVRAIPALLETIGPHLREGCVVTDGGSTKRRIVEAGDRLPARAGFVGGHPMAGSEQSGPGAARDDLFEGTVYFLTPTEATPAGVVACMTELVEALGARPVLLDAARHDRLLAATSHLPHLAAAALCGAVAGVPELEVYAGSGLRDTTRVAGGPAEVWRDILLSNADQVLAALDGLSGALDEYRAALSAGDGARLTELLAAAREVRERMTAPCAE